MRRHTVRTQTHKHTCTTQAVGGELGARLVRVQQAPQDRGTRSARPAWCCRTGKRRLRAPVQCSSAARQRVPKLRSALSALDGGSRYGHTLPRGCHAYPAPTGETLGRASTARWRVFIFYAQTYHFDMAAVAGQTGMWGEGGCRRCAPLAYWWARVASRCGSLVGWWRVLSGALVSTHTYLVLLQRVAPKLIAA